MGLTGEKLVPNTLAVIILTTEFTYSEYVKHQWKAMHIIQQSGYYCPNHSIQLDIVQPLLDLNQGPIASTC